MAALRTGTDELAMESRTSRRFRLRWAIIGVASLVLMLNYADRAALGVAGPNIIEDLGLTNSEFGLISSMFFLGYAPFCFVGGSLSDKHGPRKVMAWAITIWSIFVGLTAVAVGFISLLVVRVLFGVGEGPQGAVTTKLASNWFPQREMGRAVSIAQAGTPLGGAIGTPFVGFLIASTGDWRVPFIVLAAVGLLAALGWWIVVRDSPDKHPWAAARDVVEVEKGRIVDVDTADVPPVKTFLRKPLVIATAVAFFGYAWVLYTFLSWFPVYLSQEQGVNIKAIAITATIPWVFGVIGYLIGGAVTDKLAVVIGVPHRARSIVIVGGLALTAVLLCCIGFIHSAGAAVALMSAVVFVLYLTGGQYFVTLTDVIPKARIGAVTGFAHFIANLSGVFAPLSVGVIVDQTGSWALTFGVSAGFALMGALVMARWGLPKSAVQI
jgi:ACS family hexuronate transporter-like MFS transporter